MIWEKVTDDEQKTLWLIRRHRHVDEVLLTMTDETARRFAREVLGMEEPEAPSDTPLLDED